MFLFVYFLCILVTVECTTLGNSSGIVLRRSKRQLDGPSQFHAPAGINEDGEQLSPLALEMVHNLTTVNGPKGRCGVCWRKYRVLHELQYKPSEECRRYFGSRQASLGDLTEFYHTLYNNHRQEGTITVLLSDSFPDLRLTASFMPSILNNGPPHLMIESAMGNTEQALCVESIRCPEPVIAETSIATTATTTTAPSTMSTNQKTTQLQLLPAVAPSLAGASRETVSKPPNFWEAIMANSSPRSWVISTIVLGALCIILALILLGTCIWVCRVKRHYRRKMCRGVCRFGCKCSAETIRQAAADAAVYLSAAKKYPSGGEDIGNGSFMTYPSVGRSWGISNGMVKQPYNPLFPSLAANDKLSVAQGSSSPPSQQNIMYPGLTVTSGMGSGQNWPQYQMSMQKGKQMSSDNMWRSHSDGSSLSDHTNPSGVGSGPTVLRSHPSRLSGHPVTGFPSGYNVNASTATASTCMQSYGGMGVQAEGGSSNGGLILPGSPVRFDEFQREQAAMIGSISGNGGYEQNGIGTQPVDLRGMNGCVHSHNLDNGDSFIQPGEPANITPPSGFFDMNGEIMQLNHNNNTNLTVLPLKLATLNQSWPYSTKQPALSNSHPAGAVQVLPSDPLLKTNSTGTPSLDFKRRNGTFLNGVAEEATVKRGGLSTYILSQPLTEGVEQSYNYVENSDTPL